MVQPIQRVQIELKASISLLAKEFADQGKTLRQMALELKLNYNSLKKALALRGYAHPVGINLCAARIQSETGWSLSEYIGLMMNEGLSCSAMANELCIDSKTLRKYAEGVELIIPRSKPIPRNFENIIAAIRRRMPNRTDLRWIEHNGERRYVAQWASITGIPADTIKKRLALGWCVSETLTIPIGARKGKSMRGRRGQKPVTGHPWRTTMDIERQL